MAQQAAVLLSLVLVAAAFVNANEQERKVLEECNKDIKAPPSAIENLLNVENLDSSKEGKCLIRCGLTAFGVMREDGTIDPENSLKYVQHAYSKGENQEKVTAIWNKCQEKVGKLEDQCEHAYALMVCFEEGAREGNIPKIHTDKN